MMSAAASASARSTGDTLQGRIVGWHEEGASKREIKRRLE